MSNAFSFENKLLNKLTYDMFLYFRVQQKAKVKKKYSN